VPAASSTGRFEEDTMKCKGLLGTGLAVVACAVVATPPVLAVELSHPAAQYPTPRGLMADGLRWQGIADVYQLRQRSAAALRLQSSALPPAQGLLADGLRWQAIARAYE
jgi:hypothetical protein